MRNLKKNAKALNTPLPLRSITSESTGFRIEITVELTPAASICPPAYTESPDQMRSHWIWKALSEVKDKISRGSEGESFIVGTTPIKALVAFVVFTEPAG